MSRLVWQSFKSLRPAKGSTVWTWNKVSGYSVLVYYSGDLDGLIGHHVYWMYPIAPPKKRTA